METKKLIGITLTVLGAIAAVFSAYTIYEDVHPTLTGALSGRQYYTYQPPFTSHEILMIVLVVVGVICLIWGLAVLVSKNTDSDTKS